MQFRGREMAHPELGSKILDDVLAVVGEYVKVETRGRLEGRNMSMVLAPDKKALDAAAKPAPTSGGDDTTSTATTPVPAAAAAASPTTEVSPEAPAAAASGPLPESD
jgi:translation initiation factor IF-3